MPFPIVPAPTTPITSLILAIMKNLEILSNVRSPPRLHSHHQDTKQRQLAVHHVASIHAAQSSTNAIRIAQSRGPTPLPRHSHSPFPDRDRVRVSPQSPPLKTLHSTPRDRLHSAT